MVKYSQRSEFTRCLRAPLDRTLPHCEIDSLKRFNPPPFHQTKIQDPVKRYQLGKPQSLKISYFIRTFLRLPLHILIQINLFTIKKIQIQCSNVKGIRIRTLNMTGKTRSKALLSLPRPKQMFLLKNLLNVSLLFF